jgi:hypothetical protein
MADEGLDVPAITERPTLIGHEWLWEAYLSLNSCRSYGLSVGPIPWSAIEMYAASESLTQSERFLLHTVIRKMDTVFLDANRQK